MPGRGQSLPTKEGLKKQKKKSSPKNDPSSPPLLGSMTKKGTKNDAQKIKIEAFGSIEAVDEGTFMGLHARWMSACGCMASGH